MAEILIPRERWLYSLPKELHDISICKLSGRYKENWRLWLDMTLAEHADSYAVTTKLVGPNASARRVTIDALALSAHALNCTFSLSEHVVPRGLADEQATLPYDPWQVEQLPNGWRASLQIQKNSVRDQAYWGKLSPFHRYAEDLLRAVPIRGVLRADVGRA